LSDNTIAFTDLNKSASSQGVDFARLHVDKLNVIGKDLSYAPGAYHGTVQSASLTEHSGFTLQKLNGEFSLGAQEAYARNILIEAGRSKLQGDFLVKYSSLDSLTALSKEVYQKTLIQNSHVAIGDILFWAPDLRENEFINSIANEVVMLDGGLEGNINNLSLTSLDISGLNDTKLKATGSIRGLPDIDRTTFDLLIDHLDISSADLHEFLPDSTIPPQIRVPDDMHLDGSFNGTIRAFDADLNINTSDGDASLDGNLSLEDPMSFAGSLKLNAFDAGRVLRQDSLLGRISGEINSNLRGIDTDSITGDFSGTIAEIDLYGYQYKT
jgi:hypothetical protein